MYIGRLGVRRWPGLGPGRSCCGLVAASVRPAGLQAGVRALGPRAGRAPRGCCEEASDHANSRGRQRLLTEAAPAAFSDTLVLSSFPQLSGSSSNEALEVFHQAARHRGVLTAVPRIIYIRKICVLPNDCAWRVVRQSVLRPVRMSVHLMRGPGLYQEHSPGR